MKIEQLNQKDYQNIINVWEKSTRATHTFLKENDRNTIKDTIYDVLPKLKLFGIKKDNNILCGFAGVSFEEIEMLFIDPEYFGQCIGKELMTYATKELKLKKICVNEQNLKAFNFYGKFGFKVVKRDKFDFLQLPYPILHLELVG
jgi:putative acetyltransferase